MSSLQHKPWESPRAVSLVQCTPAAEQSRVRLRRSGVYSKLDVQQRLKSCDNTAEEPRQEACTAPDSGAQLPAAEAVLSEEAKAVSAELLRAARHWQEEHREWQRRYSQWLVEQSHWEGLRAAESDLRRVPTTNHVVTGAVFGAMKRGLFASGRAAAFICTKAVCKTKVALLPAAKRLGRRLASFGHKEAPLQQQQQQQTLEALQQQQRLYLSKLQRQEAMDEQWVPTQQDSEFHDHQEEQRQQQQKQRRRPEQQHSEVAWQDPLEESADKNLSPRKHHDVPPTTSHTARGSILRERPKALPEAEEGREAETQDTGEETLRALDASIDWIVDVGFNSAARAAAAAALQRREELRLKQQNLQGKRQKSISSRGSSQATCCESSCSAEEFLQVTARRRLARERPLVQRPLPDFTRFSTRPQRSSLGGGGPLTKEKCLNANSDAQTDCSVEDCVLHCGHSIEEVTLSDSSSSSCVARRLRASRRLRAAAAAAKRRQFLLKQRRAQATKREELCYAEVGIDVAL
ncbi:basic-leucine zipper transcription factor A [Cyclospora cayetanensis]|uniref:Basic-leucine zipper transcription factor A n=1 Tax=Cyclospora cayetanensis TaxID=88456 RepID=A0A6P6S1D6_9EIME|nr:basic-leucine zipper transcription factor A [Cyclospora cayetanensis]